MILLYKGKSLVSKAIRWRTWGAYSHAAWWMADGSVIEAWHKGGVQHVESPASIHTPGTEIDVFGFRHPAMISYDAAEKFLLEQVGKKYDFRPVISGFMLRLSRNNAEKWFCSELVHAACLMGGLPLLNRVPDWKISPTLLSYSTELIHVGRMVTRKDGDYDLTGLNDSNFQPLEAGSSCTHQSINPSIQ